MRGKMLNDGTTCYTQLKDKLKCLFICKILKADLMAHDTYFCGPHLVFKSEKGKKKTHFPCLSCLLLRFSCGNLILTLSLWKDHELLFIASLKALQLVKKQTNYAMKCQQSKTETFFSRTQNRKLFFFFGSHTARKESLSDTL